MLKVEKLRLVDGVILLVAFSVVASLFVMGKDLTPTRKQELIFYPAQEVVVVKSTSKAIAKPKILPAVEPLPAPKAVLLPIVPPQVVYSVLPEYSSQVEGRTLLKVYVEPAGKAGEVKIIETSGSETLDRAAVKALSEWTFVPARQGAVAIASWLEVPIRFILKD